MYVAPDFPSLAPETAQIGVIASATGLAGPLVRGINHIQGYKLSGLLHSLTGQFDYGGTGRFYTYRHPNGVALATIFYVATIGGQSASVAFRAGSGPVATVNVSTPGYYATYFGWGGTGWQEVTYTMTNCTIRGVSIWNVARSDLSGSDRYCDTVDPTYVRAGLNEGQYLIYSTADDNLVGITTAIREARADNIRQAVSWCFTNTSYTCSGTGWKNPFANARTWRHLARRFLASETSRNYRVYAYTMASSLGAYTYRWRMRGTRGTVTTAALARTSFGWDYMGTFPIDCVADDTLTFEMVCTNAAPVMNVRALAVCQEALV